MEHLINKSRAFFFGARQSAASSNKSKREELDSYLILI